MIFSVQNSNLMYSEEFFKYKFKYEKQSLEYFWHEWTSQSKSGTYIMEVMQRDFKKTSYDASSHHREPTWNNANDGGSF